MEHRNQTGIVGISLRVVPKYHKVQYDKDEGGEQPKITNKELCLLLDLLFPSLLLVPLIALCSSSALL